MPRAAAVRGQTRPDSIHDLTHAGQAGLVELLALTPGVTLLADAGYQGLSGQTAGAVITPRPARRKTQQPAPPASPRTRPNAGPISSQQIRVEYGISHLWGIHLTGADLVSGPPWSPCRRTVQRRRL